VELPFFNFYLKDKGDLKLPRVLAFETGKNAWHSEESWPPSGSGPLRLYLGEKNRLLPDRPAGGSEGSFDSYVSDPWKPVPYTAEIRTIEGHLFMVEDQRFAWTRPDVLYYQTEPLDQDVTIAGPITATLNVSTTGTDSDFVVKLIDVYPGDAPDPKPNPQNVRMGGFQMLLAGDILRAKFRNSFSKPEPMVPGQVTRLEFPLGDKYHTFLKGHRIMVQVQSTWFPMFDRNPQKFVDIYHAKDEDYQKATQRIYRSTQAPSFVTVQQVK
jgi:putative CocE/NonD family hydrolase